MTSEPIQTHVHIPVANFELAGELVVPSNAKGIVIFAHGSGSSRLSPRNQYVAQVLQHANIATLLLDLLTKQEETIDSVTGHLRFDIPFLASRLKEAVSWVEHDDRAKDLNIALFGASTGAGAALLVAAELGKKIAAVVSRGGRPDLAMHALPNVTAPTLLIVGGYDTQVIELNNAALAQLRCEKKLKIVPAASHLFEEPGKLEDVARLARDWFIQKLSA
jgi:dienelactone hydrolase